MRWREYPANSGLKPERALIALREFMQEPAVPRDDGQVGFRPDQYRAVPQWVLEGVLAMVHELESRGRPK